MNIYDKLASCKISADDIPDDVEIYIDYVHSKAELINATDNIIKAFNDAESLDKIRNDKVIKSIWVYMDFDLLSLIKLNLKLFMGIKEFISDKWKCDFTTVAEKKINEIPEKKINEIPDNENEQFRPSNDPLKNKEYYDSFLGYKFEYNCGIVYLKKLKHEFMKAKRKRIKELHHLQKLLVPTTVSKINYDTSMGLHYMIGYPLLKSEPSKTMDEIIIESLGRLNDNYLRSRITIINTELAFINANLKKFNQLINNKKQQGGI